MKIVTPAYKFVDYMGNRVPVPTSTRFIAMDTDKHIRAFQTKPKFGGVWWVEDICSGPVTNLGKVETDLEAKDTLVEFK